MSIAAETGVLDWVAATLTAIEQGAASRASYTFRLLGEDVTIDVWVDRGEAGPMEEADWHKQWHKNGDADAERARILAEQDDDVG